MTLSLSEGQYLAAVRLSLVTTIYMHALIAVLVLQLAVLLLMADKDVVLKRVEIVGGVAMLVLETVGAEYELIMTELL